MIHIGLMDRSPVNRPVAIALRVYLGLVTLQLLAAQACAGGDLKPLDTPRSVADFELPGTEGDQHRLTDYRDRYVLVNFWAVWCTPCRREMPSMQRLYEKLRGERFEMLAIHVGPSLDQARTYGQKLRLGFPIAVDTDMVLTDWRVLGLPTSILFDPQGRIIAEAVGERDWDDPQLIRQLEAYLSGG